MSATVFLLLASTANIEKVADQRWSFPEASNFVCVSTPDDWVELRFRGVTFSGHSNANKLAIDMPQNKTAAFSNLKATLFGYNDKSKNKGYVLHLSSGGKKESLGYSVEGKVFLPEADYRKIDLVLSRAGKKVHLSCGAAPPFAEGVSR